MGDPACQEQPLPFCPREQKMFSMQWEDSVDSSVKLVDLTDREGLNGEGTNGKDY